LLGGGGRCRWRAVFWSNPPLTPDGLLDYARLSTAEIAEDLYDGLFDRVVNGGQAGLQAYLERLDEFCPEFDEIPPEPRPSDTLVGAMGELLRLEVSDSDWTSERARGLIGAAVEEKALVVDRNGSAYRRQENQCLPLTWMP
jgi:hypothetical protein